MPCSVHVVPSSHCWGLATSAVYWYSPLYPGPQPRSALLASPSPTHQNYAGFTDTALLFLGLSYLFSLRIPENLEPSQQMGLLTSVCRWQVGIVLSNEFIHKCSTPPASVNTLLILSSLLCCRDFPVHFFFLQGRPCWEGTHFQPCVASFQGRSICHTKIFKYRKEPTRLKSERRWQGRSLVKKSLDIKIFKNYLAVLCRLFFI